MSKGSWRRATTIGREEELLRWRFAYGKITKEEFRREWNKLVSAGAIRHGRHIQELGL